MQISMDVPSDAVARLGRTLRVSVDDAARFIAGRAQRSMEGRTAIVGIDDHVMAQLSALGVRTQEQLDAAVAEMVAGWSRARDASGTGSGAPAIPRDILRR